MLFRSYADKNQNSEVIGVYGKGDSIPISNIKYGPWRKVIAEVNGQKKIGWVYIKDIVGSHIKNSSEIQDAKREREGESPVYHRKTGIGLFGALSYVYQKSGTIDFNTMNTGGVTLAANYSAVKGNNFFLGLFGDFNLSPKTAMRVYFAQRSMDRSGSATIQNNSATSFRIEQSLMSLGAALKWYSSPSAIFWWGPGLEIGKTTKMTVHGTTASTGTVDADASKKPTFAMLTLGAGYDYNISGHFFVLPEARFGVVPNGSPFVMVFELMIPVAYTF